MADEADASRTPGESRLVEVGPHRIEATVFGMGEPTVVIEPGFGGYAEQWRPIAERVAADSAVVTYDRCPYGSSSPAVDGRTPGEIARDLHGVLDGLGVSGSLILVGHSAGGRCVREYAAAHPDRVAGMVLVDSSFEGQQQELIPLMPWKLRLSEMICIPLLYLNRWSKMTRAARHSMIRELRALNRQTRADLLLPAGALGDRPLIVLTRPPDRVMPRERGWQVWHDRHRELAGLSRNHRHIVGSVTGHDMHLTDPDLVVMSIRAVIESSRLSSPLPGTRDF
jgi:pimeloyl-ACP methyl ester carboxylesterase